MAGSADQEIVPAVAGDRADVEDAVVANEEVVARPTEDDVVASIVGGAVRAQVIAGDTVVAVAEVDVVVASASRHGAGASRAVIAHDEVGSASAPDRVVAAPSPGGSEDALVVTDEQVTAGSADEHVLPAVARHVTGGPNVADDPFVSRPSGGVASVTAVDEVVSDAADRKVDSVERADAVVARQPVDHIVSV
jgi:hypothetical protein